MDYQKWYEISKSEVCLACLAIWNEGICSKMFDSPGYRISG